MLHSLSRINHPKQDSGHEDGGRRDAVSTARSQFRVLAIDDEATLAKLMSRMIAAAGFPCVTASDGVQGLSVVEASPPDLIVTDIRMPHLSGVEMMKELLSRGYNIPVIFVTGYAEYGLLSGAIRLQPAGFLEKPFDPDQLTGLVERAYTQHVNAALQRAHQEQLERSVEERTRELEFRTERLLAEKELLQGIISQANFGLVAVDTMQTIHLANLYALQVLKTDLPEAVSAQGLNLPGIVPAELRATFEEMFVGSLSTGELRQTDIGLPSHGTRLNVISYPIIHRQMTTAVVFIMHDVTEKVLLQQRLLQTAKLASIGELAAGVAHEINNPVGFVTSNCNTLKKYLETFRQYVDGVDRLATDMADPKLQARIAGGLAELKKQVDLEYIMSDIADLIEENTDGLTRVSRIVSDLKSFARVESDRPEVRQINTVLDDALNLCRNETKYGMEITRDLGELPEIPCLPNQLVQVFTNIILNAVQAVKGEGTLHITTARDNNMIKVGFRDTGPGIPENIRSRIFDPFFTTKEPGRGTGMGLSISYGIVKKHGGTLTVESEEGAGTEFAVMLPVDTEQKTLSREIGEEIVS